MKKFILGMIAACGLAAPAMADSDIIRVESDSDVTTTADRLVMAVENAGAKVFARIDHGAGAKEAGMDIGDSQLIVFGNPKVGTPIMEKNREAGLVLPVRVLVYQDTAGKVWVAHEDIADRLDDFDGLDERDAVVAPLVGALNKMTNLAAGK